MTPAARDRRRVALPLTAATLAGWGMIALSGAGLAIPSFCRGGAVWTMPDAQSFAFAFVIQAPGALALAWGLMLVAMMVPLLQVPLCVVRSRVLARYRGWAVASFVLGYAVIWCIAGLPILAAAMTIRMGQAQPWIGVAGIACVALVWQISPWRQRALNRCHRQPVLAAGSGPMLRDACFAGVTHGVWCVATCWALMLLALLIPVGHISAMLLVSALIWCERIEQARAPRWGWARPDRSLRLLERWIRTAKPA